MSRYIVNDAEEKIHDGYTLTEQCNIDEHRKAQAAAEQAVKSVSVNELELLLHEGFKLCQHCFGENRGE